MNKQLLALAAKIVSKADREHPADSVLRTELKQAKTLSRQNSGTISLGVFAYYRWLGWLDQKAPIESQIQQAMGLDQSYQEKPTSIPEPEMKQAVPAWTREQIKITPEWLRALQRKPGLWLRARLETGWRLAGKLGDCWVAGNGFAGDALRYDGQEDLFRTPEFHAGEFELQDISSQIVGWACDPQPGETWWDACAGEGGKTLHLCDLMRNKGLVWASDRAEWRLKRLKQRTARAKLFNYRTVLWDGGTKLPTKTKFDGILVDAPCSGVGTWQRNPQARWTTLPHDVTELSMIQQNLVANAIAALKPTGRLIYSVCTLTKAETEDVADAITQRFPELKPSSFVNPLTPEKPAVNRLWLWPQDTQGNGMFICGWEKKAP